MKLKSRTFDSQISPLRLLPIHGSCNHPKIPVFQPSASALCGVRVGLGSSRPPQVSERKPIQNVKVAVLPQGALSTNNYIVAVHSPRVFGGSICTKTRMDQQRAAGRGSTHLSPHTPTASRKYGSSANIDPAPGGTHPEGEGTWHEKIKLLAIR